MVDAEGNREAWKIFLWRGIVKSEKCFWVINLEMGGGGRRRGQESSPESEG